MRTITLSNDMLITLGASLMSARRHALSCWVGMWETSSECSDFWAMEIRRINDVHCHLFHGIDKDDYWIL